MKGIYMAAFLLLPAVAIGAETVQGKIACLTRENFEDFVKFAAAQDMESIEAYMSSGRCFQLKDGIKVTVIEYPGILGGIWEVAYKGQKFFVQREGITNY